MRAAYILWDEQRYKFNHSRPAQSVKCDRGILAAASEQSNVRALFVRGEYHWCGWFKYLVVIIFDT